LFFLSLVVVSFPALVSLFLRFLWLVMRDMVEHVFVRGSRVLFRIMKVW
jgi:hypothetical protein